MDQPPPSPLLFVCWPCRQGKCLRCDLLRGCEHWLVGRIDGRLVLCPALTEREA